MQQHWLGEGVRTRKEEQRVGRTEEGQREEAGKEECQGRR